MFTKSPNNNTWVDRGSPKQALLKKKARSTILSVLSKRQTQERNFIGKNQTERQSWSSDSTLSDPDTPKPSPTKVNERSSPTYERSPRTPNEAIPVKPGYHYSRPSELSQKSPRQYSERSTSQSSGTPEFSRIGRSPIVSPVSREFSPKPTRTVFEFQPQITRQPSFEERKPLHSPVSPTSSFSEASPNTPPKTAPKPARSSPKPAAEFRSPLESGSNFVIKPAPGEPPPKPDKPYSVVIQSTARYPPPKPRRSSADVTPYTVTVNSVRVFEATPKMVEADPKLYSKWERYPSRDLPVMSPSFKEQFDWEISRKGKSQEPSSPRALGLTGIPVSDGDTTPRGIPLPARRISVSSDNEPEEPPKLISDSVQVSIPFGIRDVPKSSRDEGSWASRVSVCVPFQVFQGEAVKVSPEAQEALDNAQYSQLKAIAESEDRAAHNPMRVSTTFPRNVQQIISPTEQSVIETAKGQWGPVRELARGQRFAELNAPTVPSAGVQAMNIPSDAIDGPHLVSVGGQQMAQEVHIPMRVNEQMVQGMPDASRDVQDGAAIGKHGKYSVSERARKGRADFNFPHCVGVNT